MKKDITFLVLLAISAVIFLIFISPFLEVHGLAWLSIIFYGIVIVTFIYGQTAIHHRRRRRRE